MSSVGLMIVGDELLSGKRQDKHLSKVIDMLNSRGMSLEWAHFAADDENQIAEVIRTAQGRGHVLLSCGGIGGTPDDRTRQAAARAFDVPIARHPDALAIIEKQYGDKAWPNRVLMADFPLGAGLIPNPINNIAGFYYNNCFFVPGFPEMAWPMLEWVLDVRLGGLHNAEPPVEYTFRAYGSGGEGDLIDLMEATLSAYPPIKLASLPFRGSAERERHIEFGIKGPRADAEAATRWFRERLLARGDIRIEDLSRP